MRRTLSFLSVVLLVAVGTSYAQQKDSQAKEAQGSEPASSPIPANVAAMKNPVKPTAEGMAEARKLYGYHCAMCHGANGDGKGDLAVQMKLELNDWRDPNSLSKFTDGQLFYIITNGRGKMVGGEGDRTKEEVRWNLVTLVHSYARKSEEPAKP